MYAIKTHPTVIEMCTTLHYRIAGKVRGQKISRFQTCLKTFLRVKCSRVRARFTRKFELADSISMYFFKEHSMPYTNLKTVRVNCCVRGYHVYQELWEAAISSSL